MADARIRINWTIPVPIILAIIVQAGALLWFGAIWKTTIENSITLQKQSTDTQFQIIDGRINFLEKNAANSVAIVERVKGVEVNVQVLKEQSQRIEQKLDTALERRR